MAGSVEAYVRELDHVEIAGVWGDLCKLDRVLAAADASLSPAAVASTIEALIEPYGFHEELPNVALAASDLLGTVGQAGLATRQVLALGETIALQVAQTAEAAIRFELLTRLRVVMGRFLLYLNVEALRGLDLAANRDALTGLRNKRCFDIDLGKFAASGQTTTVALVDVDGLKRINDTFGHLAGNELLVRVATTLSTSCADGEYAYRFGGDEYAFLSDVRSSDEVLTLLTELSTGETPFSYGVATIPGDADSPEQVFEIADTRMYECKAARKASLAADIADPPPDQA